MHTILSLALGGFTGLLLWAAVRRVYPLDPWWIILAVMALFAVSDFIAGWKNDRANERQDIQPSNSLRGSQAIVQSQFTAVASGYQGRVQVAGESWKACSAQALAPGDKVRIIAREGLMLRVQAL